MIVRHSTFAAVVLLGLAGCSLLGLEPPAGVAEPARPLGFDRVALGNDRRTVQVDFIGAAAFHPAAPCTAAYDVKAVIVDDAIEIGIFEQPHPAPLQEGVGCADIGHPRSEVVVLDRQFDGIVARSLADQIYLLEAPPTLATVGPLPAGWELRREGSATGVGVAMWDRTWSPDPDPWVSDGDSLLTLTQSFGGPINGSGDEPQPPVLINGQQASYWRHPPTGSMTLAWELGDGEVLLGASDDDFTLHELIDFAESVVIPGV
jgi:hypothetical protein